LSDTCTLTGIGRRRPAWRVLPRPCPIHQPRQLGSAWKKVFRLALPNDLLSKTTSTAVAAPVALVRKALASNSDRAAA